MSRAPQSGAPMAPMAPFTKSGHHQDKVKTLENVVFSRVFGGEGGIRTRVRLLAN